MPEPEVDDQGRPETPARQAAEKARNKHLTYASLALGALGAAFLLFRRGGSGSSGGAAAGSTAATPGYVLNPITTSAGGSWADGLSGALQNQQAQNDAAYQGLMAAIAGLPANNVVNPSPSEVQFAYGSQLQDLANVNGKLVHRWTGVGGNWQTETLASGLQPGAQVAYTLGQFGTAGRIDYTTALAAGGTEHGWYLPGSVPGSGWHSEALPAAKA